MVEGTVRHAFIGGVAPESRKIRCCVLKHFGVRVLEGRRIHPKFSLFMNCAFDNFLCLETNRTFLCRLAY